MQVRRTTDGSGRPVLEKRAGTPEEVARLRREADLLDVAAHPGLVELVGLDDGAAACLRTGLVDGTVLLDKRTLDVDELAGVVAALASTLADLHAMGLVHGAVASEHVLLDEDGRPVLCSLGYGGLAGERPSALPALPPVFADPSRAGDDPLDPAVDVFGVGAILRSLLAEASGRPRRVTAEALERLAERATAPQPAERPTARELADAVHDSVLGARLPGPGLAEASTSRPDLSELGRRQRPLERWRRAQAPIGRPRRRAGLFLGVAGAASAAVAFLAILAILGLGRGGRPPTIDSALRPGRLREPATSTAASATPATVPPLTTTLPPRRGDALKECCPTVESVLSADVDGDGCAEALRFIEGVVEAGSLRWAVGESGDLAAVGDWACVGTRSLALLRPGTGEVFAFDGWATAERAVHAPLLARIGGGRTLRAADLDRDGCHELVVERATGAPAVLRAPRPRP